VALVALGFLAVPERALELSFAMLQLFVASQLVRRALRAEERSA
jgi:hypothetical protein